MTISDGEEVQLANASAPVSAAASAWSPDPTPNAKALLAGCASAVPPKPTPNATSATAVITVPTPAGNAVLPVPTPPQTVITKLEKPIHAGEECCYHAIASCVIYESYAS